MPTFNYETPITVTAGTNVTNFRFAVRAAADKVNRVAAAGAAADGIVVDVNAPLAQVFPAGEPAPLCTGGQGVPIEAGDAIADDAEVMSDADGRAIPFVAGGGALALGRITNGLGAAAAGVRVAIAFYPRSAQHI